MIEIDNKIINLLQKEISILYEESYDTTAFFLKLNDILKAHSNTTIPSFKKRIEGEYPQIEYINKEFKKEV